MRKLKTFLNPVNLYSDSFWGKVPVILTSLCSFAFLCSCSEGKMVISSVGYQSIRTSFLQPDAKENKIPDEAEIILAYTIGINGELGVGISNNTDEIMVIDQAMSFFISDGQSISYYDPTIRTQTVTNTSSKTKGGSVNLGAVNDVLNIGGRIGSVLNRINVGGSRTVGTSIENTTITADQPRISIGPRGSGTMSKTFTITGVGQDYLSDRTVSSTYSFQTSPSRFSVCISYSLDGGQNFKKIVTDFYVNSSHVFPVTRKGMVNESLRKIYKAKSDALNENLWILHFNNSVPGSNSSIVNGYLYDYQ